MLDDRDTSLHQFSRKARTGRAGTYNIYNMLVNDKDNMIRFDCDVVIAKWSCVQLEAPDPSSTPSEALRYEPCPISIRPPFQNQFSFPSEAHLLNLWDSSLRSTSEETSAGTTPYVEDEPKPDSIITKGDSQPVRNEEDYIPQQNEAPHEGSLLENLELFKFLEDLDIKFDYEDTSSILVFGGGAAVALWLLAAVVSAIDSIPVFPKVLELVGLGYTVWFSSRYLVFKKNRDELVAKIEQIKQQVLGSKDE
ncbi:UNVERIFIED_CONTAM: protein CURVATURE THYLAKOID 1D, chloroplastic [Sesamum angustifolium]|uniref:Protein CURVATURE THYLAKOID 1D, chloroplastic n=1 Tax=Sesamum angustifolium TaxID=2727405 RepID=A0AAW2RQH0_9LAMI